MHREGWDEAASGEEGPRRISARELAPPQRKEAGRGGVAPRAAEEGGVAMDLEESLQEGERERVGDEQEEQGKMENRQREWISMMP